MTTPDLPKGVTLHRGKLRIAFRPPNEKAQWKRSLGIPPTKANIKAAELMLNSIRRDISLGSFDLASYFPNDPSLKKEEKMLSRILHKHIIEAKRGLVKGSTLSTYERHVERLLRRVKDVDLSNLNEREAKQLRDDVISAAPSDVYANKSLWLLRTGISRAVRELDLPEDNMSVFLAPVESRSRAITVGEDREALDKNDVYTITEAERLIEACLTDSIKRLVTFLFWSGLRPGEAAALEREDVCLPYITVRRTLTQSGEIQTTKTGYARKIYLPSFARSALEQQLLTHDFERVWLASRGRPFTSSVVLRTRDWKRLTERAGVAYLKPYITRHSFASWMLKAGEPETAVAAHLGHTSVSTVRKVYGKFIPDAKPVWTLDDPTKLKVVKSSMGSDS